MGGCSQPACWRWWQPICSQEERVASLAEAYKSEVRLPKLSNSLERSGWLSWQAPPNHTLFERIEPGQAKAWDPFPGQFQSKPESLTMFIGKPYMIANL